MPGSRITDISALETGRVWALLTYSDGSQFCLLTTLNTKLLNEYGIILEDDCLPRLDKKYLVRGEMIYKQFRYTNASISLWTAETYTDKMSAVLSRFI